MRNRAAQAQSIDGELWPAVRYHSIDIHINYGEMLLGAFAKRDYKRDVTVETGIRAMMCPREPISS